MGKKRANIDLIDKNGYTPLAMARILNKVDLYNKLLAIKLEKLSVFSSNRLYNFKHNSHVSANHANFWQGGFQAYPHNISNSRPAVGAMNDYYRYGCPNFTG